MRLMNRTDFLAAIQSALAVGAFLVARQLSALGTEQYPEHPRLRNYAHILAPPKVIQRDLPPDSTLFANRDWIMTHRTEFQGQWVALRNGELLGAADSLDVLTQAVPVAKGILFTKVF
jgi:hypothetical protein